MIFNIALSALALVGLVVAAPVPHEARGKRHAHPKRGSAFNNPAMASALGTSIRWAYNWGYSHDGSLPKGVEYTPMLWSATGAKDEGWFAAADKAIKSGAKHLLAFNEPDFPQQANMTPEQAVAAWRTNMEPFHTRAKLISPAVTNGGGTMGQAWLDKFLQLCTGCHVSGVALHIYDDASNTGYYQGYLSDAVKKYTAKGHPVWVTEIGVNSGDAASFINTMVPFLDNLKGLHRYAFFMSGSGDRQLNNGDGSLNAAGNAYKNAA